MLVVTFFQLQIHQSVIFLFPVFCLEVQFQANFCSFEGNLSFFLLVTLKSVCFSLLCLFLPPFFFKCAYIWFSFYSSLSVCKIEDFWYNVFFFFLTVARGYLILFHGCIVFCCKDTPSYFFFMSPWYNVFE